MSLMIENYNLFCLLAVLNLHDEGALGYRPLKKSPEIIIMIPTRMIKILRAFDSWECDRVFWTGGGLDSEYIESSCRYINMCDMNSNIQQCQCKGIHSPSWDDKNMFRWRTKFIFNWYMKDWWWNIFERENIFAVVLECPFQFH